MIEERGRVTAVEPGYAWVSCASQAGCQRCAEGKGCGGGVLGKVLGDRLHRVRAATDMSVMPGDQVVIGLDESVLVRASLMVYLIPLLGAIIGAILAGLALDAQPAHVRDLSAAAGAALGLVAGIHQFRRYGRRAAARGSLQPTVLRRTPSSV